MAQIHTRDWVIYKEQGCDSHTSGSLEVQGQGSQTWEEPSSYIYPRKKERSKGREEAGCRRVDREEDGREENTGKITGLEIHVLIFISLYFLLIALWLPHSTTGMMEEGGGSNGGRAGSKWPL